ncbi:hypothetical protein ACFQX9_38000 [Bradyrhizobium sp. GCM10028915]|uniref:hypothetical protein n=1 Tax=Bradyrhizobium sp. GCM10028915 TaxID=3273385 RepID=UPI003608A4FC
MKYDSGKLAYAGLLLLQTVFAVGLLLASASAISPVSTGWHDPSFWLSFFSERAHDFEVARISAIVSVAGFLVPALFVMSPLPRAGALSVAAFVRVLVCVMTIAVPQATISSLCLLGALRRCAPTPSQH